METGEKSSRNWSEDESLKMAIAVALVRSKLQQNNPPPPPPPPPSSAPLSDVLKWKRKAKERKLEITRLKEDLKIAEDSMQQDMFPQGALCKCYFFDNLGQFCPISGDDCDQRFSDVLYRRFLRQVRINERKRRIPDASRGRECVSEYNNENEVEKLRASVDFLVEICDSVSTARLDEAKFKSCSHQAVDFILDTLKTKSGVGDNYTVESVLSSLIMRLLRRMCNATQGDEDQSGTDVRFYIQHLMRKLGSNSYTGQRIILSVSQRISLVAEGLLFMDPFDGAFPNANHSIYLMIQLIEFLVSDYLLSWSISEEFDTRLLEEWVVSVMHARKALEVLECRSGLYVVYIDRVVGLVAKQVGQFSFLQKLNPQILANLFS
ncbi:PREDICTED: uncharacterized protein LOC109173102 [Ipomoea nil]|uniref:uncharacterized protein LOC109173102 n=1 Tax=Ipomoea nil TaxID=35883 RepID=UPI000900C9E5|nr:PREDICTED: uncharacterized protein LOC109173102 [Ipomoea nil]